MHLSPTQKAIILKMMENYKLVEISGMGSYLTATINGRQIREKVPEATRESLLKKGAIVVEIETRTDRHLPDTRVYTTTPEARGVLYADALDVVIQSPRRMRDIVNSRRRW